MWRSVLPLWIATGLLLAVPGSAVATDVPAFRTPKQAVYCSTYSERYYTFSCWTPNDGFWVRVGRQSRVRTGYSDGLRHYAPKRNSFGRSWPVLRFGKRWSNDAAGWSCVSRSTGLTCKNPRGHGWWLGRFVGYRIF